MQNISCADKAVRERNLCGLAFHKPDAPAVAGDLGFRRSCLLAKLTAILLSCRRHAQAGLMRTLFGSYRHRFLAQ
jgi:hypothetical protein